MSSSDDGENAENKATDANTAGGPEVGLPERIEVGLPERIGDGGNGSENGARGPTRAEGANGSVRGTTEKRGKGRVKQAKKDRGLETVLASGVSDVPAVTGVKPAMLGSVERDFDLDAMAAHGTLGQLLDGTSTERPVTLGKPPKTSWFQVDPLKFYDTFLVRDAENRDAVFVCPPDLRAELEADTYLARLYLSVTRSGSVFLIPVRMPSGTRELDSWSKSAHEAFARYRAQWFRLLPNMEQGCYVVRAAPAITDPPSWPEEDLRELLKRTLRDRVLTAEHALVKRLRGEA